MEKVLQENEGQILSIDTVKWIHVDVTAKLQILDQEALKKNLKFRLSRFYQNHLYLMHKK